MRRQLPTTIAIILMPTTSPGYNGDCPTSALASFLQARRQLLCGRSQGGIVMQNEQVVHEFFAPLQRTQWRRPRPRSPDRWPDVQILHQSPPAAHAKCCVNASQYLGASLYPRFLIRLNWHGGQASHHEHHIYADGPNIRWLIVAGAPCLSEDALGRQDLLHAFSGAASRVWPFTVGVARLTEVCYAHMPNLAASRELAMSE